MDWAPAKTPPITSEVALIMLLSGCWVVRDEPAVVTWVRNLRDFGFLALNRSFNILAQILLIARVLAISQRSQCFLNLKTNPGSEFVNG